MQWQRLIEILLSIPPGILFGVAAALGLLLLLQLTMTKNRGFKEQILQSKKLKAEVIKYLVKNLETAHFLTDKTIKDNEVIGMYNTETIILNLRILDKIENILNRLPALEDDVISQKTSEYTQNLKSVLTDIYYMEENYYEYKKKSEQTVITYDREFRKLMADGKLEHEAAALKKEFKKELEVYKENIAKMENTGLVKRDDYHNMLTGLNQQNLVLQELVDTYKQKNIDAKKFYPSKLVYV